MKSYRFPAGAMAAAPASPGMRQQHITTGANALGWDRWKPKMCLGKGWWTATAGKSILNPAGNG